MSSLTTIRSTPSTTSGRRLLAPMRAGTILTGRRLAKSSIPERRASNPLSGRCSRGKASNRGLPIAASKTASAALQASRVLAGKGSPVASMAEPPIGASLNSSVNPCRADTASRSCLATAVISGPMPSPGSKTTRCCGIGSQRGEPERLLSGFLEFADLFGHLRQFAERC